MPSVSLLQRISPGIDKIVQDMDMLYNTKARNAFCEEWKAENGEEGEDLYKHQQRRLIFRKKIIGPSGPTGTSYFGWLVKNSKDGLYKMTDRSLYGARPPFVKIFIKEEKLDGMSEDESAKRVGMTLLDNSTDCNCGAFETEIDCAESGIGCIWRPLFEVSTTISLFGILPMNNDVSKQRHLYFFCSDNNTELSPTRIDRWKRTYLYYDRSANNGAHSITSSR